MLRDDNRHLKDRILALEEENQHLRRMLFGSGSEKMEKGDWIVTVEEEPQAATESGKKVEGEAERKPQRLIHCARQSSTRWSDGTPS